MSLLNIGKGIRYLIVLNVLQVAVTLIFYHIISSFLTKSDIGISATLTFVYTMLITLSSLALPAAGTKYVAEYLGKGDLGKASVTARSIIRLVTLSSLIIAVAFHIVLIVFFFEMNMSFINIIPFSLICIASFLASLKLTYRAFIRGLQLYDKYAIVNFSTIISSYLIGVFLVLKFGLIGFAFSILIGEIIGLAISRFFYLGQLPKSDFYHNYEGLLKFSIPIFVMQLVTLFSVWADRILFLILSLNLELLGVYDLAIKSAASILVIEGFLEGITLPVFSKVYGKGGIRDISSLFKRSVRYLGFLYFPTAFGLAIASRTVMTVLYGQIYAEGGVPLAMLSISSIFVAFGRFMDSTLRSIGKTQAFILISLISLSINAIIVVILTPFLGIMGATVARISSSIIVLVLLYLELRRWIKIDIDLDGLWKGLICSLISAASIFCFDILQLSSAPVNLCLGAVFGFLSYVFALVLLRALRREDFKVFRQILPIITSFINFVESLVQRFIK